MIRETLKIHRFGNPVLRRKARLLKEVTAKEKAIFERMLAFMYESGGVGLAGPQVGISKQMIVVDIGECPVMLANPRIIERRGSDVMEEGCLSLPEITVKVRRAKRIIVEGIDPNNKRLRFHAQDLLARAIQHESDHLRGKLIIDYANFAQRLKMKKKLKVIAAEEKHERMHKQKS